MAASAGKRAEAAAWLPGVAANGEDADLSKVHESLTDMIKQVANEPSVGLFFVQQHVHKAVPVLVSLKSQLVEITHEANVYTEDARDALQTVKVMKDCGPSTVERMVKILASSTSILSSLHRGKSRGPLPANTASAAGGQQAGYVEHVPPLRTASRPIEFPRAEATAGISSGQTAASSSEEPALPHLPDPLTTNRYGTGYIWTALGSALTTAGNVTTGVRRYTIGTEAKPAESPPDKPASGYVTSVFTSALQRAGSLTYAAPSDGLSVSPSSRGNDDAEAISTGRSAIPTRYMRAVYDTAVQTAGTVGREGSKLFRLGSKVTAVQQHSPGTEAEVPETESERFQSGTESFDEFQAEQAAQLEAWLGDEDSSQVVEPAQ